MQTLCCRVNAEPSVIHLQLFWQVWTDLLWFFSTKIVGMSFGPFFHFSHYLFPITSAASYLESLFFNSCCSFSAVSCLLFHFPSLSSFFALCPKCQESRSGWSNGRLHLPARAIDCCTQHQGSRGCSSAQTHKHTLTHTETTSIFTQLKQYRSSKYTRDKVTSCDKSSTAHPPIPSHTASREGTFDTTKQAYDTVNTTSG